MATTETILRRIISIILICIFAFSITPAIVFHDLFSAHADYDIVHNHKHNSEVAKAGINCHFDSFVGKTSFVNLFTPFNFEPHNINTAFLIIRNQNFYSQHHFYAELRGPPVRA